MDDKINKAIGHVTEYCGISSKARNIVVGCEALELFAKQLNKE